MTEEDPLLQATSHSLGGSLVEHTEEVSGGGQQRGQAQQEALEQAGAELGLGKWSQRLELCGQTCQRAADEIELLRGALQSTKGKKISLAIILHICIFSMFILLYAITVLNKYISNFEPLNTHTQP